MSSFNKVILMGNLTRDPEMRHTPSGTAICRFSLAVNRKFRTEAGEDREEVAFIDCDAFRKQAELIGQHFGKGKPILVEGRLKQDSWEDKTSGEKKTKLFVSVESFSFVGGGTGEESVPGTGKRSFQPKKNASPPPPQEDDDDVPF